MAPVRRHEPQHVLQSLCRERFPGAERAHSSVDGGEEGPQTLQPRLDEEGTLALRGPEGSTAALGRYRPLGFIDRREHLAQVPAESALHDLLHHSPEVGRRLVVVTARTAHGRPPYQMPIAQAPDVHGDVALALLELGGDFIERQRAALQIQQPEDPSLQRGEHSRRSRGGPDAIDEYA